MAAAVFANAPASGQESPSPVPAQETKLDAVATSLMPVPIFTFAIQSVAFSPDGELLVSGNGDGRVRIWRNREGPPIHAFQAHSNWVFSIKWLPDGLSFLTAGGDNLIHRFSRDGASDPIATLAGHQKDVHALAVSRDGRHVLSGGDDGRAFLWDLEMGVLLRKLEGHSRQITSVALSPDDRFAVTGSRDNTIRLWRLDTGETMDTWIGHASDVMSVAFSPDGRTAASASYDGTVRLWDIGTGRNTRIMTDFLAPDQRFHNLRVFSVAFSPDGRLLAGSGTRTLRLWDVMSGRQIHAVTPGVQIKRDASTVPEHLSSTAFSPDGHLLAAGSTSGSVYVIAVDSGQIVRTLTPDHPTR